MSSISYILAYLSGPSLYRIYRQARLVSITTLYNNPNVGKIFDVIKWNNDWYILYLKIIYQGQGYAGTEQYIGNAGERYGGMVMSCVSMNNSFGCKTHAN